MKSIIGESHDSRVSNDKSQRNHGQQYKQFSRGHDKVKTFPQLNLGLGGNMSAVSANLDLMKDSQYIGIR